MVSIDRRSQGQEAQKGGKGMTLKRQLIYDAYEEIGLASYAYDLSPEEIQSAVRKLDQMISTWSNNNLKLGFVFGDTADIDAGTPEAADDAIAMNLAIRLAPSHGKSVSPDTKAAAAMALTSLYNMSTRPQPQRLDHRAVPKGQGERNFERDPFLAPVAEFVENDVTTIVRG